MQEAFLFIQMHVLSLGVLFLIGFIIGLYLGLTAGLWNKEKKKKGYKTGVYKGVEKEIDQQMTEEYKKAERARFSTDDMEHHSSEKFRDSEPD